jgi:hypothetical protein
LGGGALSIVTNDLLFSHPQPTQTSGADGLPAGGGHTGAAPGRGAVPNDAIAPSVERGALVQERPQRFSLFHRGALAQVVEAEIEAEGEVPEEEILREEPEQADFAWGAPTEPAFEFRDPELAPVESPDVPCREPNWEAIRNGRDFEELVRSRLGIGPRAPFRVDGRARIADGLNNDSLTEVKFTSYQPFTQQLRDELSHANLLSRRFNLVLSPRTTPSGPLWDAHLDPTVNLNIVIFDF